MDAAMACGHCGRDQIVYDVVVTLYALCGVCKVAGVCGVFSLQSASCWRQQQQQQ
jgi:hypothetical protein